MKNKISRERMITFLLETPFFEKLEPTELMEIIHIVEVEEYQAGDTIFNEGDEGDAWYVVYRGMVDVLKKGITGETKIAEIGPKGCFGEMSILNGLPRSATIRADEDSTVLRVKRGVFGKLIEEEHLVAYKLLHEMAILLAERQHTSTTKLSGLLDETDVSSIQSGIRGIVGESSVRD